MRRNADGWSIGPIVRRSLDDLNVREEGRGELRWSERVEKPGRIREHGIVVGIDINVPRAEVDTAKSDVEGRRIVRRMRHERVLGEVFAEICRGCGFGRRGEGRSGITIGRGRTSIIWRKLDILIEAVKVWEILVEGLGRGWFEGRQIGLETGEKRQPKIVRHVILLRLDKKW